MPILAPAGDTLVPVRIIVRDGNGDPVTNTTNTDVPLADLLAAGSSGSTGEAVTVIKQAAQPNSAAVDVTAVNVEFNALLAKLRSAGILASS